MVLEKKSADIIYIRCIYIIYCRLVPYIMVMSCSVLYQHIDEIWHVLLLNVVLVCDTVISLNFSVVILKFVDWLWHLSTYMPCCYVKKLKLNEAHLFFCLSYLLTYCGYKPFSYYNIFWYYLMLMCWFACNSDKWIFQKFASWFCCKCYQNLLWMWSFHCVDAAEKFKIILMASFVINTDHIYCSL